MNNDNTQKETGTESWDKALLGKPETKREDLVPPKDEASSATEKKHPSPTPSTVLLVDDDPLIIRMYQKKLTNDGYKVLTALNGEEALIRSKAKPDVILLDVMMPKMNGVETLKALKGDEKTQDIPVIILTNLGDKSEDIENAKKLGALDYLVKSEIKLNELSDRVKKAIETGQ